MNSLLKSVLSAALALSASVAVANDRSAPPNAALTATDFVMAAASADEFERRTGELAAQRATSSGVRELAQRLVADHTKTSAGLAAAAAAAGVPAPVPRLHPGQQRAIAALDAALGEDFDKIYLQQQAEVHRDAIGLLKTYAAVGDREPLVAAAQETRPLVERHLRAVFALQRSIE